MQQSDNHNYSSKKETYPNTSSEPVGRAAILAAVKKAQPDYIPLPESGPVTMNGSDIQPYQKVLEAIGGKAYIINDAEDIIAYIEKLFPEARRIVSTVTSIEKHLVHDEQHVELRSLQDVEVAIVKAKLAVAETGAIWVTEEDLKIRVLPFICENLVAIVEAKDIVANMHEAYEVIGNADYGFGVFIAGPSKTADIEQSLVLGAHGPKSMTVLIVQS